MDTLGLLVPNGSSGEGFGHYASSGCAKGRSGTVAIAKPGSKLAGSLLWPATRGNISDKKVPDKRGKQPVLLLCLAASIALKRANAHRS